MTSDEIRSTFLDYFARADHRVVRSSSLIPSNDPTLLFTNAGMNQFKDVFLGREDREYRRAATSQKCMRAGGKHNDLENVGYTNRHLTFFEMLGNFSFGDYFKTEAIAFAWELMTEGFGLPADRLHATVFEEDDESYAIWKNQIGLPEARLSRLGHKDNFWAMGDTGPCGPCSEIHLDLNPDGPAGQSPGDDDVRFIELWNLVFMQFDRDGDGILKPLPKPSIDTGMGLERITMVLQGVDTVYDTDLLRPLIDTVATMASVSYGDDPTKDVAMRVIADHIRSSVFLLADGSLPANDGRGYVQRRIIRRASRFGKRLGFDAPFLVGVADCLIDRMAPAYPELEEVRSHVRRVLQSEEERFQRTLHHAGRVFEDIAERLEGSDKRRIPAADAFRLKDTYGLPLDTLRDMAEVRGLEVDEQGFERIQEEMRNKARASWRGGGDATSSDDLRRLLGRVDVGFVGYGREGLERATVVALLDGEREVDVVEAGHECQVVLDATPFYPEGGGQVGDRGSLRSPSCYAVVADTRQPLSGLIVHRVAVQTGQLRVGDVVEAQVDNSRRRPTALNHSATHLLHAALRNVLGEHVKQAGSLVAPDRLRFDFSHYEAIDPADRRRIQELVNRQIQVNDPVQAEVMPIEDALAKGALAFFGDKYGDRVRTIRMGDFSIELCGGTHAPATGSIGYFSIVDESSVASGVRRIEAVTSDVAVVRSIEDRDVLEELAGRLHVPKSSLVNHVESLRGDLKSARREIEDLKLKLASAAPSSGAEFELVGDAKLAVRRVDGLDAGAMRRLADELRTQLGSGVVVLGAVSDGKGALTVAVTKDLTKTVDAGRVVRELAAAIGGKGGGRADLAQAGGPDGGRIDGALARGRELVVQALSGS